MYVNVFFKLVSDWRLLCLHFSLDPALRSGRFIVLICLVFHWIGDWGIGNWGIGGLGDWGIEGLGKWGILGLWLSVLLQTGNAGSAPWVWRFVLTLILGYHPCLANVALHYAEVTLQIVTFKLSIPWLDNSTVLCLPLLSMIVNSFILQNTFWSYKYWLVLVQFCNWQGEPLIEKYIF